MQGVASINHCSGLLGRKSLFSALLLVLLLKDKVHGAFTQSLGSTSQRHGVKSPSTLAPISKHGRHSPGRGSIPVVNENKNKPQLSLNAANNALGEDKQFKHVLAILTMPYTSVDRIANEAVLFEALQHSNKLSIVLKCEGGKAPSLTSLRKYVGEVYSQLWDFAMASEDAVHFNDVVVYPQNLPNSAAEQWLYHRKDLDAVCSHDSICGWTSEFAQGRGTQFQFLEGNGFGGLDTHVAAVNADRQGRDLPPVEALHVANWPLSASSAHLMKENVVFVDDEMPMSASSTLADGFDDNDTAEDTSSSALLGGVRIPDKSLFNCVAVGGTFDGMHYGHRKLLTLAVSSVVPVTGN